MLILSVGVPALTQGASAEDKLRDRQKKVQRAVGGAKTDLEHSSKALRAAHQRLRTSKASLVTAQRRLAVSQKALVTAQRLDAVMQARLQAAEAVLARARVELAKAKQAVVEQRAAIGELAASNYINGDPALMGLAAILNSQDPEAVTSQLNTASSLMSKQTVLLDGLRDARQQLAAEEERVERATEAVAAQRKVAAANLVRKQNLEREAATARTEFARIFARNRVLRAQAARIRKADARQVRLLIRQERRIRQLIIERAARQRGGFRGDAGGFLYRPVPGPVTSPYGYRTHPIYGYWGLHDGVDMSGGCGTPLRAAGSGVVISKSWSGVYGNRLYLDLGQVNGKNMTVVYNHMSSYSASSGERVRRGEIVGAVGSTGWSTGCHLHFTVLRDGNPVDPMGYM